MNKKEVRISPKESHMLSTLVYLKNLDHNRYHERIEEAMRSFKVQDAVKDVVDVFMGKSSPEKLMGESKRIYKHFRKWAGFIEDERKIIET